MAALDQAADHIQHPADFLCSERILRGRLHIHPFHVFLAFFDITLGNGIGIHSLFNGLLDDLIVHIGKVGNKIHLVALVFKIPSDRIKHDHRPRISYMNEVVYRRSADIHLDLSRFQRHKFFLLPRQCIKNFHSSLLFDYFPQQPPLQP